ncbi:hypothetical protein OPV22_019598 [Ensete ventricosum]|uniref:S5 DRBM domain-containing protein n=1 Tax=Ensete ventricosum TaxID=4639 RepID=A0AAV8QBW2_ENSVE|nr:hypothetical protein OPV22_019598 [Ensete ventricosum]
MASAAAAIAAALSSLSLRPPSHRSSLLLLLKPLQCPPERAVQVRRVTKIVKGGKRLSFRVIVVVGDKKGQVGAGVGKAKETVDAIAKSSVNARRNIVSVPMTKYLTFPHSKGHAAACFTWYRCHRWWSFAAVEKMRQFQEVARERGIPMEELWR